MSNSRFTLPAAGFGFGALSLSALFVTLALIGNTAPDLGWLDWPFFLANRMADLFLLPFSIVASMVFPAVGHHYPTAYYITRGICGGVGYAALLTWLWRGQMRHVEPASEPTEAGRRSFLLGGLTATTALGVGATFTGFEPSRLQLVRYEISIKGLPPALDGFAVGHISDTHFGPYIPASQIRAAIDMVNAEAPDLIALTGDYAHRTSDAIAPGIALFAALRPKIGVVAVLGNHDHWEGAAECRAAFAALGVPLIDNDRRFVTPAGLGEEEVAGESLAICGVGDMWEDQVDLDAATRGISSACPRILLSHNPDVAEEPTTLRIDLQLSGHTHGGQVNIPFIGTPIVPSAYGSRYAGGHIEGPRWPVVVSRGVGMAILPVRVGVPPEVGIVVLRAASPPKG